MGRWPHQTSMPALAKACYESHARVKQAARDGSSHPALLLSQSSHLHTVLLVTPASLMVAVTQGRIHEVQVLLL